MTISLSDNNPRISYSVSAGVTQTSFTVPFEFFDLDDLNVYVDGVQKTKTTHYTLASGGSGSTGSITLSVTGVAGGSTVVITRDIDLERTTDFQTSGPFNIASLNTELDRFTAIAAELQDGIDRSLRLTDFDAAANLTLPDVNTRKGKTLAFNASTGAVEAGPSTSDVQTVSATAADIATLADIEDGTNATNAIQTVAGISGNVSTVAGISGNVTTVAGISANVTTVASDTTDIGTVASNISSVNTNATNISAIQGASANASTATTKASEAAASQVAAASSASSASTSASTATTKAAEASTSASNASTSETNSASSATASASSATAAAASQTAAAASAASAASSFDSFDDRYLGVKSSDPTVDNDGNSLVSGALYFSDSANEMRVFDGANFIAATSAGNVSLILYEYTATNGQTTFSGSDDNSATLSYTAGNLQVVMNGVILDPSDFTATSGTSVVLAAGAAANDLVNIYAFKSFTTADMVSKTAGGTFSGNVAVNARLDVDNIRIDGNTMSSTDTNGDITLDPDGTGDVVVASGNLGVGTSSPAQLLEISGSAPIIRLTDTGATNNHSEINADYTSGSLQISADTANASSNSRIIFAVDNTERMRIDASGRVTMPNQPSFRARNSGITNYTSVGDMSWGVEDFDVGNNFSGATFTCPIDGLYFFSFNVFANTGHSANIDLLHNGGIIGRSERGVSDGGYETIGLTLIFSCSTNDTVKMKLNSGQVHTNGTLNYFTGYLIG
nr:putative phage tail fiber protein [uncultured Mediterranean phage uvMED]